MPRHIAERKRSRIAQAGPDVTDEQLATKLRLSVETVREYRKAPEQKSNQGDVGRYSAYDRLPEQRRRFVDAMVGRARGNAAEAARLAGYSRATAPQQAHVIKKCPLVREAITERLNDLALSAERVLAELAAIAEGSMEDFITVDAAVDAGEGKEGGKRRVPWALNLRKARQANALGLIQELGYTAHGPRVKLYSRLEALLALSRQHGVTGDKGDVQGSLPGVGGEEAAPEPVTPVAALTEALRIATKKMRAGESQAFIREARGCALALLKITGLEPERDPLVGVDESDLLEELKERLGLREVEELPATQKVSVSG